MDILTAGALLVIGPLAAVELVADLLGYPKVASYDSCARNNPDDGPVTTRTIEAGPAAELLRWMWGQAKVLGDPPKGGWREVVQSRWGPIHDLGPQPCRRLLKQLEVGGYIGLVPREPSGLTYRLIGPEPIYLTLGAVPYSTPVGSS